MTIQRYLEPTQEAGRVFLAKGLYGNVVMLNLLRFRAIADYSANPELASDGPITGEEAYRMYMDNTLPYLKDAGGEVLFYGKGGPFLIGPSDELWDACMLVSQSGVETFLKFASHQGYLPGLDIVLRPWRIHVYFHWCKSPSNSSGQCKQLEVDPRNGWFRKVQFVDQQQVGTIVFNCDCVNPNLVQRTETPLNRCRHGASFAA